MISFLIEKEVRQLLRNGFLPRMIVMMPLMMMLVLPWAANQEVTDLGLCIVDHDRSTTSRRLIAEACGGDYFYAASARPSYSEALEEVKAERADLVLEIPRDWEKTLTLARRPASVFIAANAVNGTKGTIGLNYLSQIVHTFGSRLQDKSNHKTEIVQTQFRYNPHLDYKIYMVPAMMVMLLTLLTGFLPALNIVGEKESGTIEQINVSPVGRSAFILAKLIPYWAIGLFVMSLCLGLAALVYGLIPKGSLGTVYFFAGVYILVVSGLGLVVSNYSRTMQQAVFVIYFFMMILLLMSGLLTPVTSMPDWAQTIATLNPLKYFVTVMRAVFLKGSQTVDLLPQLYALLAFAAFFNVWAIVSYKKSEG